VLPQTFVMIYCPGDQAALETVWEIAESGYRFARGV